MKTKKIKLMIAKLIIINKIFKLNRLRYSIAREKENEYLPDPNVHVENIDITEETPKLLQK